MSVDVTSAPGGAKSVQTRNLGRAFALAANASAKAMGHPLTFIACCLVVVAWAATGPLFGFSETWQLIINTGTTIVTFLMVFLIQNTQNRDGAAVQAKLDELIRSSAAQNAFIGIEHLPQEQVDDFLRRCEAAAASRSGKTLDQGAEELQPSSAIAGGAAGDAAKRVARRTRLRTPRNKP